MEQMDNQKPTLVEKLKALFNPTAPVEVQEQKYLDAKLVDGTIVRVEGDEFKPGEALKAMTEAGELVQAPEGMHETIDGLVLVVDAEGKITEVRKPEIKPEVEAEMETEPVVEEKKEENSIESRMAYLEEKCKMLEEAMALLVNQKMEVAKVEVMETLEKENAELKIKNEELSKVPAANPVKTKRFEKLLGSDKAKNDKTNYELINKISALRNK